MVDDEDRVLLLHWRRPSDGVLFWLCPGGGIEEGEDDATALAREVAEETGLRRFEAGPHVATWNWSDGYQHRFYLVRCSNFEAATGEGHPEYEVFEAHRWWSSDELDQCVGLGPDPHLRELLQAVLAGRIPSSPLVWRD